MPLVGTFSFMCVYVALGLIGVTSSLYTDKVYCPIGCNCTEISAHCDTLNIPTFQNQISNLKLLRPKEPLILKNGVFKILGLTNLDSIQIEHATILEMDQSAFEGMAKLSSIEIHNSNIATFDPDTFTISPELRKLKISTTTFPPRAFIIKSRTIQELEISKCGIYEITNETFADVPQLTYLNVANNRINAVNEHAFSSLLKLEEIVMSNNHIFRLPTNLFSQNLNLFIADLSNNPISSFAVNLSSSIEKITLNSCELKGFNSSLIMRSGEALTYLDLSDNQLTSPSNLHLENLKSLEFINLANNGFTEIGDTVFIKNYNLLKIILDNNNFGLLPNFVCTRGCYFSTYSFSCKNCGLTSLLDETFASLRALITLTLSHNRLQGHHLKSLQDLPSLIELDLSYNNIATIEPSILSRSSSLERLNLAGNPIRVFNPAILHGNRVIKSLNLSFCQLEHIWKNGVNQELPSLRHLNVANNQLSLITTNELNIVSHLQVFDISNNSLQCTKEITEVIQWLTKHNVVPGSQSQKVNTHESLLQFESTTETLKSFEKENNNNNNNKNPWKMLADNACTDDYYNSVDDELDNVDDNSKSNNKTDDDDDDDDDVYADEDADDDDEEEDDADDVIIDDTNVSEANRNSNNTDANKPRDEPNHAFIETTDYQLQTRKYSNDIADDDNDDADIFSNHNSNNNNKIEYDYYEEDPLLGERVREVEGILRHKHFNILWPSLVFIFTALLVLVIAANIMLLFLRKGQHSSRHLNLPHIKIPQWNVCKMKKHSGSIYRPLTEDNDIGAGTVHNTNYQIVSQLPSVHNSV